MAKIKLSWDAWIEDASDVHDLVARYEGITAKLERKYSVKIFPCWKLDRNKIDELLSEIDQSESVALIEIELGELPGEWSILSDKASVVEILSNGNVDDVYDRIRKCLAVVLGERADDAARELAETLMVSVAVKLSLSYYPDGIDSPIQVHSKKYRTRVLYNNPIKPGQILKNGLTHVLLNNADLTDSSSQSLRLEPARQISKPGSIDDSAMRYSGEYTIDVDVRGWLTEKLTEWLRPLVEELNRCSDARDFNNRLGERDVYYFVTELVPGWIFSIDLTFHNDGSSLWRDEIDVSFLVPGFRAVAKNVLSEWTVNLSFVKTDGEISLERAVNSVLSNVGLATLEDSGPTERL